jgi:hypothetical protein
MGMAIGNANMFKRFKALQAAIKERVEFYQGKNNIALQADIKELAEKKEFQSRGHGGKHHPKARFGFAFAQREQTSKYQPHQGKKEIARRLARMSA